MPKVSTRKIDLAVFTDIVVYLEHKYPAENLLVWDLKHCPALQQQCAHRSRNLEAAILLVQEPISAGKFLSAETERFYRFTLAATAFRFSRDSSDGLATTGTISAVENTAKLKLSQRLVNAAELVIQTAIEDADREVKTLIKLPPNISHNYFCTSLRISLSIAGAKYLHPFITWNSNQKNQTRETRLEPIAEIY